MGDLPGWALALLLVSAARLQIPSGLLIDQLLRYQYRYHPDLWDADGRPSGFVWCPKDAEWFLTTMRQFSAPERWIFRTPDWIRKEPRCLQKLNVVRVLEGFGAVLTLVYAFVVLVA